MAKTLGLALGTGGARGWAHLGVIRALEEAGIKIDYLAGTSIGSLVGAIYMAGNLDQLEEFAEEASLENLMPLMDVTFPSPGLIDGDRIHDFIAKYVLDNRLEDTPIPFQCVATNFLLKREVVLSTGLMVDAVRASIAIPGIFAPFKHGNNIYLVDGGIINPLPISVVREMGADVIVAVNLNQDTSLEHEEIVTQANVDSSKTRNSGGGRKEAASEPQNQAREIAGDHASASQEATTQDSGVFNTLSNRYDALKDVLKDNVDRWIPDAQSGINIFDVLGNSINVMEKRVTEVNLLIDKPDVLIEPDLEQFGTFDFHQSKTIIPRGYEAAKAMLPTIQELLES